MNMDCRWITGPNHLRPRKASRSPLEGSLVTMRVLLHPIALQGLLKVIIVPRVKITQKTRLDNQEESRDPGQQGGFSFGRALA